jgi:hypothetical protein
MRSLAAIATATVLLALPGGAFGQAAPPTPGGGQGPGGASPPGGGTPPDNSPLAPLSPSDPAPPPPAEEQEQPEPEADDDELGTIELLAFAGIAALLIGAAAVAVARGGRKLRGSGRGKDRGRRPLWRGAPKPQRPAVARATRTTNRRDGAKVPPPPPRKRHAKAKRR